MNILISILNNPLTRLVFGFIISGTAASPVLNGYTDNKIWVVIGCSSMATFALSVIFDFKLKKENSWIIWVVIFLFALLLGVLYFRWA